MLDRNGKGSSVQKHIIEQRQQQQDAGVRVPGPETVDLKRRQRVATIEQSQQRVAAEHHSRQRNPRKNYPNAQISHADFLSRPSFLLTGLCPQYTTIAIIQNAGFVCRSSETRESSRCGAALNRIALPTVPTVPLWRYAHISLVRHPSFPSAHSIDR